MIDVKKFVVVFLILAAVAGSSALVLLNFGSPASAQSGSNAPPAQASASSQNQGNGTLALGSNAFTRSLGQTDYNLQDDLSDDSSSTASSSDPNNLTSQLADSMLSNLFAANPDGPQTTSDGQQIIAEPDADSVVAGLSTSTLAAVQVPDWDYEAETITTQTTSSSDENVEQYVNALNTIGNDYFVNTDLQDSLNSATVGPSDIDFAGTQVGDALNGVKNLVVPANLADFQKSLVKLLVYEQNSLALANSTSTSADPVKSALVFQAEDAKYQAALQDFQDEFQSATQSGLLTLAPNQKENGLLGFVNSVLGISQAQAFGWEIVFNPTEYAQLVEQSVKAILLQLLKNTIVTLLQNRSLKFIQNNGNPRYVTGWGSLLSNSFNAAVGTALGQIEPGLCVGFSADVSGWLKQIYPSAPAVQGGITLSGGGGTNCTLQNSVGSTAGFFNDFNTGGWNAFGALLAPQNNAYGAFATAYDETLSLGGSAQTASQNKAVAGQGYQGISVCGDGTDAAAAHMVCSVGVLVGNQCVQPNGTAVVGTPVQIPAGCSDGSEPITTFPGANAADTLNRNLSSDIDLVVNAGDITGLLATVTTALLQQVIMSGVNALMTTANAGAGAAPVVPPAPIPVACNPTQVSVAVNTLESFGATGGSDTNYTWTTAGGTPATGSGPVFNTTFTLAGNYTVTVTGNASGTIETSACQVQAN
ncbi:MAG TPA: PKD domain-containing protein [Candidatus Paceibacterota bacterium]|nr:PKD domain-containing protein [Candidatus Paceibacterota bacterium]